MSANILIIEDSKEFRDFLREELNSHAGLKVMGSYTIIERALKELEEKKGLAESLDIILLDQNLPGMKGVEAIHKFKELSPQVKIIMLTASKSGDTVKEAIKAGVRGYIIKSSKLSNIIEAIKEVHSGKAYLDANVSKYLLKIMEKDLNKYDESVELTKREYEVLKLLAEGFTKKEIGKQLEIAHSTVVTHICKLYDKLIVKNAAEAVSEGYKKGLLPPS